MNQSITWISARVRRALATVAFMTGVAFVAAPSSPIAGLVPGVGDAFAYAPCQHEYVAMQDAWAIYLLFNRQQWALDDFIDAWNDYHHCMAG